MTETTSECGASRKGSAPGQDSLFDQASRVFDGWTDAETGVRVLRLFTREQREPDEVWQTVYHQHRCFLDGGRKVLLGSGKRMSPGGRHQALLNLTTGAFEDPFPPGYHVMEVMDSAQTALLSARDAAGHPRAVLWDLRAGRELASASESAEGWHRAGSIILSDGRRALLAVARGRAYDEPVQSRIFLFAPGELSRTVLEVDRYHCNHMQSCPTDPELFAYDRWPSPMRNVDQVISLRSLDGRISEPVKLSPEALRPAQMWGVRDHYVWTPDGRRIVSYLFPHPITVTTGPEFNHFKFEWWLSATDWRTGEDLAAKYPPGRWGGHMQMTPDSRYILCGGGPGFDKLFAVSLDGLRQGWNEHIICSYPKTEGEGKNSDPFPYPFALPDSSGVIFNAGWPGPQHGVYLAEWPASL